MSLPLLVLRPEPGNLATLTAARALGLDAHGFPLFAVTPRPWPAPEPETVDALLLGSANAVRHAGGGLAHYAAKPVYAVGEATAAAARAVGLTIAAIGEGALQPLLARLAPGHRRLLRLAGEERVSLTPPAGVTLHEAVVYASEPLPLPGPLALLLTARALPGAVVLLHSAEAAHHFAAECDRIGAPRTRLHLAALARRVAEAAGLGWASLATAAEATDSALLALAAQLCQ